MCPHVPPSKKNCNRNTTYPMHLFIKDTALGSMGLHKQGSDRINCCQRPGRSILNIARVTVLTEVTPWYFKQSSDRSTARGLIIALQEVWS